MRKGKYKVRNWAAYNEGLKQRGVITVWISEEALAQWRWQGEKKRGGQPKYSDLAIEVCLVVRQVYHLGYRQTEGFVASFFKSIKATLPVPDFSVICRRSAHLGLALQPKGGKAVTDIVVDSTGLKVYGEGEWKVRKHGWGKHRTWMKLHVALDADSQQVRAVVLTTNAVDDAQAATALVNGMKQALIGSFTGDGAYDKEKVRKALHEKARQQGEDLLERIPPQRGAVRDRKGRAHLKKRNDDIGAIRKLGREQWKVVTNYHERSKAETFMFRYKAILGSGLKARNTPQQQSEVNLGCKILNRMLQIAKPQSEKVA